jgi:hypothetical protein
MATNVTRKYRHTHSLVVYIFFNVSKRVKKTVNMSDYNCMSVMGQQQFGNFKIWCDEK